MNNNNGQATNSRKIKALLFFIICAVLLIAGQLYRKVANEALKNSDVVTAHIIHITPTKNGSADILVSYSYKGIAMHNDFSVGQDSFRNGEAVLIKVAKAHPNKYIGFVRKL